MNKSLSILVVGATSGLGQAVAEKFAAEGHAVLGTGRNVEDAVRGPVGGDIVMGAVDVCDESSVERFAQYLKDVGFVPDIAVLSAGFGIGGPIEEASYEQALKQFQTNYFGVDRVVKSLLPQMREARDGHIVIVGSIASKLPLAFQGHYVASKAAVAAYGYTLAQEVMRFGIKVTVIEPGDHQTAFTESREFSISGNSPYESDFRRAISIMEKGEIEGASSESFAAKIYSVLMSDKDRIAVSVTTFQERLVLLLDRMLRKDHIIRLLMSHFRLGR